MKVLPDTSIWIPYLRSGARGRFGELDRLLLNDSVVVCGPVLAELLIGIPASERDEVWLRVGSLPWADLDHDNWRTVSEIASALRSKGRTLPLTDVVIAVACIGADAFVWTDDADFERIRTVEPRLRLYRPPG